MDVIVFNAQLLRGKSTRKVNSATNYNHAAI